MHKKRTHIPLIIAHRGAVSTKEEENTITSFRHAIEIGVDGLEMDLRMTRDNTVVLAHERRVGNGDGRYSWVDKLSIQELRDLKVSEVILFEDVVRILGKPIRRLLLDLDLKQPGMEREIVRILRKYTITNVLVCSPDIWILKAFEDAFPTAIIGLTYVWQDRWDLMDNTVFRFMTILLHYSLKPFLFRLIRRKTAKNDIQVASIHQRLVNQKVVQFLHQYNIQVFVWGTDREHRFQELIDLGVEGIKTKRPEVLIKQIIK